jgi:diacylglycerol kinase (ATP)
VTSPRVALIVNPAANKGRGGHVGREVARHLAKRADVSLLSGDSPAASAELIEQAASAHDAVFVCGGDGIVHLAVNALAQGDVPLGIIPAGSGNDTAFALGLSGDPHRAADQLLAATRDGSVRRIDLGYCELAPTLLPRPAGRWWVTMLYAGFDSGVNERANAMRWPRGKRRYDLAIAAELLALRRRPLRMCYDGQALEQTITLVAIGNGPHYGGGKRMTPGALMDDGVFDVTVVGAVSRLTLANLAPRLPHAGHIGHPAVTQYRARTISIEAPETVAYADGERVGPLPLRTECVPGALPVLVPPGEPTPGLKG